MIRKPLEAHAFALLMMWKRGAEGLASFWLYAGAGARLSPPNGYRGFFDWGSYLQVRPTPCSYLQVRPGPGNAHPGNARGPRQHASWAALLYHLEFRRHS
jgi:hypothetical protein